MVFVFLRTKPSAHSSPACRVPAVYLTSAFMPFLSGVSERRMNKLTYEFAADLMVRFPPAPPVSTALNARVKIQPETARSVC